jgi:hypothetical protein
LALGIKAAVQAWRHGNDANEEKDVDVFATAGAGGRSAYVIVFLALPTAARSRWR